MSWSHPPQLVQGPPPHSTRTWTRPSQSPRPSRALVTSRWAPCQPASQAALPLQVGATHLPPPTPHPPHPTTLPTVSWPYFSLQICVQSVRTCVHLHTPYISRCVMQYTCKVAYVQYTCKVAYMHHVHV